MYEIQIGGRRLSAIGADIRAMKADASKVMVEEMKKVKGFLANLNGEMDTTNVAVYAAKALQHVKNAVSIGSTVGIPIFTEYREQGRCLFHAVMTHPLYHDSPEMLQLAADLSAVETNPHNWA